MFTSSAKKNGTPKRALFTSPTKDFENCDKKRKRLESGDQPHAGLKRSWSFDPRGIAPDPPASSIARPHSSSSLTGPGGAGHHEMSEHRKKVSTNITSPLWVIVVHLTHIEEYKTGRSVSAAKLKTILEVVHQKVGNTYFLKFQPVYFSDVNVFVVF